MTDIKAGIDFPLLVEQGVDAWNQWRIDHPSVQPDLSHAYLYGCVLSGFDLSNTNFERACLIGANLKGANLSGACLRSVYASDSTFAGANLTGSDLSQGNFRAADFSQADLSAAGVEGTEFAGVTFTGSCWVAIRTGRTSFSGVKGEYVYLDLPPAGRHPRTGVFRSGELSAFLQQRFSPRMGAAAGEQAKDKRFILVYRHLSQRWQQGYGWVSSYTIRSWQQRHYRWRQLRLAKTQLWALCKIKGKKLGRRLVLVRRQLRVHLKRTRPYLLALSSRLRAAWTEFELGNSNVQRGLSAGHHQLRRSFLQVSEWLQVEAFRQSERLYVNGLLMEARLGGAIAQGCRYAVYQRTKQWRSLKASRLQASLAWTEFVQGNGRPQRRTAAGHQWLQSIFLQVSEWLQVEAFRQSERLYAGGLVVEHKLRGSAAKTLRYLNQSEYVQLVLADLKKEYRRGLLPIVLGAIGALTVMLFYPLARPSFLAERESSVTAKETATDAVSSISSDVVSSSTDLSLPASTASPPALTTKVPLAGFNQNQGDAASLSLPCSVAIPASVENLAGYRYQDGSVYYGEVVEGQPADGEGTMTYPTGNRYTGSYKRGRREGCGTFYFSDGRRYVGQFKADEFDGLGTWILENGERYIGEFKNNQCNGQGSFIFANGSIKSGMWQDGALADTPSVSCEWGSLQVPVSTDN